MNSLIKKLSSRVLPRDQLLPLLEPHLSKKHKKNELPWVEVVKRLLTRASDVDSKVLFENANTFIKIHLDETVRKGLKNPGQLSQRYSDALNSLLTHLHFTMENTNLQVTEMHRLSSLILAAVIDTSITAHQKGEESVVVAKIFMKLTLIFGHSQELLLDALLHCRTLIQPGSRRPSIQVPLIKRLFSSVRNGQPMSPLLYLKYLLLGKLWLFMTEKTELGKTRTYIAKMLKLPKCVPEWAEREEVPWLRPSRWNTRLVMKSMTLTGALETFYGNHEDGSVYSGQLDKRKKLCTAPSQKTKCGPSKSSVNRSKEGKVKTENTCIVVKTETTEECLRASVSELEKDEDVKQELQIVDLSNHVSEEGVLSCNKRNKKGAREQPTKKSIEAGQKAKKRKTWNHMEETETSVEVTSKRRKIKHRTDPEVPDHIEEEASVEVTSKRTKIKHKTKPKVPDTKYKEGNKAVKRLNKGIIDKANARHVHSGESSDASAITPETEDLQGNVNSIHETEIEQAEPVNHSSKLKSRKRLRKAGLLEGVSSSHKIVEQPWKLKSRKRLGNEELAEDTSSIHKTEQQPKALEPSCKLKSTKRLRNPSVDQDGFSGNFTRLGQFSNVPKVSANAIPQGISGQTERKARSRKCKLSKKLQRIRRNCMTFMVTDLEAGKAIIVQEESEEDCCGDKEELSGGENSDLEAVNTLQTKTMSSVTGKGSTEMEGVDSRLNQKLSRESNPLHNITADKPDTCSEDSSDYDRSDGEAETLSETLACDGKQEESTGWLSRYGEQDAASSENPEESDEERVQEAENTTDHMSEKESNISHNEEPKLFVLGSDTDSGREEEPEVELVNTGKGVTVDGEKDNNETVTLEDRSNISEKEECASTADASDKSGSIREISCENLSSTSGNMFKGSYKGGSELDNASSKNGDSDGKIVITECKITKLDKAGEEINMNASIEEIVDLSTSDQEVEGEGCMGAAGEVQVIQNHSRHQNAANLKYSRISNGSQAFTVPDSESDIEIVMEQVTLKNKNAVCGSGSDVLEVPGSEDDITYKYDKLKAEAVHREVERILKEEEEELKQKRETKQASPISEQDADITNTLLPHKSSEKKYEASQDPVSKMMNNLYKTKVASSVGEEEESSKQPENLKVLNTQHSDEAVEATEKVMVRQGVPLEDSASHLKEPDTPDLDDDEDSKSVELIDGNEDIECVLQNIFNDTGRATSISGLREKLLSEPAIKEEMNDHKEGKETKGAVRAREILPQSFQAKTADSPNNHLSESFASTADVCVKPEKPADEKDTGSLLSVKDERIDDVEDTETLLRSIVNDEGRMAGIRGLRERLLSRTPTKEEATRSANYEVKAVSKEAVKDTITFPRDSQDTGAEKNSKSLLHEGVVGAEAIQSNIKASSDKKLTGSVNRKDDSVDEMHRVEETSESSGTLCTESNGEPADTDGRSNNTSTREEKQQLSDHINCKYEEYDKYQGDEPVCCTSGTGSRGNNLSSANGREKETSPKTLETEIVEENRTEGPPDASQSTDGNSLPRVDVNNTEMESIMEEPLEKSTESTNGADEAYEASSDASEDPAPRTRRRSRSLRKSFAHQDPQQASDSDSSPVRAARWKISVLDITGHQRPKRKRSQSCSLETLSLEREPCNMTPFLQNSGNKTYIIEKEHPVNTTFTIEARRLSYSETSVTPKDESCFFGEKELVGSESKQDASSTESVLDVSVESSKSKLSEGEPQPHKNGSDLPSIILRRASEEGAPLPTLSIVLNETSKTDPPESSFNTSSESLFNREMLSMLTSVEKDLSPSSGSSTEPFVETASPSKLNSNYAGQADESVGLGKDAVPSKAVEVTTPKPCLSHTEERTSNEPVVLPRECSHKSKNSEVVKEKNPSLSENAAQKSLGEIKKIANGESHSEAHQMEDCDTHEKARTAQDPENESEHEEIRKDTDGSEKVVGNEINQEMVAEIYEGEEVEVLSTSGIEEEDEGETVRVSPEALGDDNSSGAGAEKVDHLISKKSLRSHVCQQHSPKDGKEMNADTGSKESKLVPIPAVKVHCLSEVALTKEVLISPEVSDEECELVSPGVDLNRVKFPIEEDDMEDAIHDNNATSVCFPSCSLQKGSGGINSPHKTIPEEQDESTIPGNTTESIPKLPSARKGKSTLTPPSLSTQSPEKLAERSKRTRRSSKGVTSEGSPSFPQSSDTPKSTKTHTKPSKAQSIIQEEPAAVMSDPEGMSDTSSKSSTEIKRHKRKETVVGTHDNSESLMCKNDSLSTAAKGSRPKELLNSPISASSPRKDMNDRSSSHERMLPSSQNQNSEPSHEDPERYKCTESQAAKHDATDASGEEREEVGETKRNGPSSLSEEEVSSCDAPHQSATKTRRRRSSSLSTTTLVRRSSRLMKQPSTLSSLTNDTRNPGSSTMLVESERETEEAEERSCPGSPMNLRKNKRTASTTWKAASETN